MSEKSKSNKPNTQSASTARTKVVSASTSPEAPAKKAAPPKSKTAPASEIVVYVAVHRNDKVGIEVPGQKRIQSNAGGWRIGLCSAQGEGMNYYSYPGQDTDTKTSEALAVHAYALLKASQPAELLHSRIKGSHQRAKRISAENADPQRRSKRPRPRPRRTLPRRYECRRPSQADRGGRGGSRIGQGDACPQREAGERQQRRCSRGAPTAHLHDAV